MSLLSILAGEDSSGQPMRMGMVPKKKGNFLMRPRPKQKSHAHKAKAPAQNVHSVSRGAGGREIANRILKRPR